MAQITDVTLKDFSDPAEKTLVDYMLGIGSGFGHSTTYVALFTDDPGESGNTNEVSDSGYSRQSETWSFSNTYEGDDAYDNDNDLVFGPMNSIVTVTHIGLYTLGSVGEGTQIMSGALSTDKTIVAGTSLTIQAGQIGIQLR